MTSPAPAPVRDPRHELTAAVLLSAVAGALALSAGGQPWADVTVTRRAPLPPYADVLTGGELAPLVPATGLLLLAAAVALIAVRGWGRVAVGLLSAVAGGALAVSGVRALTGSVEVRPEELGGSVIGLGQATVDVVPSAGWPVLALVAGGRAAGPGPAWGGATTALPTPPRPPAVVRPGRSPPRTGTRRPGRPWTAAATPRPTRPTTASRTPVGEANPVGNRSGPLLYSGSTDPTGEGTSGMWHPVTNPGDGPA